MKHTITDNCEGTERICYAEAVIWVHTFGLEHPTQSINSNWEKLPKSGLGRYCIV